MGYGDFKMNAAVGAFLGWKMLPLVILLSSVVGLGFGALQMFAARGKLGRGLPLPFRAVPRPRRHHRDVLGRADRALVPAASLMLRGGADRRHRQRQERRGR